MPPLAMTLLAMVILAGAASANRQTRVRRASGSGGQDQATNSSEQRVDGHVDWGIMDIVMSMERGIYHDRADLQLYERSDVIAASQLVDLEGKPSRKGNVLSRKVFRDCCLCSSMMWFCEPESDECNHTVERGGSMR